MSLWDTADILARVKRMLNRPATDAALLDADIYAFMTEGQQYWLQQIAMHAPTANQTIELMTSSDSGATYTVTHEPLGYMVVRSARDGVVLTAGPEWDPTSDFQQEGKTIRIPNGKTRVFANGPYAYYTPAPAVVDGSTAITMKPDFARVLIADYAAIQSSIRLKSNTEPFEAMMQRHWAGDPSLLGDGGILSQLKTRYDFEGVAGSGGRWWSSPDLRS